MINIRSITHRINSYIKSDDNRVVFWDYTASHSTLRIRIQGKKNSDLVLITRATLTIEVKSSWIFSGFIISESRIDGDIIYTSSDEAGNFKITSRLVDLHQDVWLKEQEKLL